MPRHWLAGGWHTPPPQPHPNVHTFEMSRECFTTDRVSTCTHQGVGKQHSLWSLAAKALQDSPVSGVIVGPAQLTAGLGVATRFQLGAELSTDDCTVKETSTVPGTAQKGAEGSAVMLKVGPTLAVTVAVSGSPQKEPSEAGFSAVSCAKKDPGAVGRFLSHLYLNITPAAQPEGEGGARGSSGAVSC
jgi:hypothetical protein